MNEPTLGWAINALLGAASKSVFATLLNFILKNHQVENIWTFFLFGI